jgi:hypothetical protein
MTDNKPLAKPLTEEKALRLDLNDPRRAEYFNSKGEMDPAEFDEGHLEFDDNRYPIIATGATKPIAKSMPNDAIVITTGNVKPLIKALTEEKALRLDVNDPRRAEYFNSKGEMDPADFDEGHFDFDDNGYPIISKGGFKYSRQKKRKSHKKQSNKRKSHKKQSNKRKSNKRK